MKESKIFIVNLNQLSITFWEEHLNLTGTSFWNWESEELALYNMETINPDIIIIDGYWDKEPHTTFLKKILAKKINNTIFCISPEANLYARKKDIDPRLRYSVFSIELTKEINELIESKKNT